MTRGDEDIEPWSLKFWQPLSLAAQFFRSPPPVGFEVYKFLKPHLLAQQFFQSPPFGCLNIFGAAPQYISSFPPCHVKWTFPYNFKLIVVKLAVNHHLHLCLQCTCISISKSFFYSYCKFLPVLRSVLEVALHHFLFFFFLVHCLLK